MFANSVNTYARVYHGKAFQSSVFYAPKMLGIHSILGFLLMADIPPSVRGVRDGGELFLAGSFSCGLGPMEVDVIIITMSVESLCCRMSLLVLGSQC